MSKIEMHDNGSMLLIMLNEKGPLSIKEIQINLFKFASQFGYGGDGDRRKKSRKNHDSFIMTDTQKICDDLIEKSLLKKEGDLYTVTEEGKIRAEISLKKIRRVWEVIDKNIMSPEATSRNTVIIDAFLAFIKLLAGFISGSIALIADGTDAAVDTLSALIVFFSVKFKNEIIGTLVIIGMMFFTSISIGINSVEGIVEFIKGNSEVMKSPELVIGVEIVAFLFAILLTFYQRSIGKKHRNFALISQSVDSKNHIYVSLSVIAGAVFSIFGIQIADSIIGSLIAVRIFLDGIELSKESFSNMKGEEINFGKYTSFIERKWHAYGQRTFQAYVLYSLMRNNSMSKEEITEALEENFKPDYVPLISEFSFGLAKDKDFKESFSQICDPLINANIMIIEDEKFKINHIYKTRITEYITGIFMDKVTPALIDERVKDLKNKESFSRKDKLVNASRVLKEDEKISSLVKGKFENSIYSVMCTDERILLLKGRESISIYFCDITDMEELEGKFSTIKLEISTKENKYIIDYLSRRKSFGFLNDIKQKIHGKETAIYSHEDLIERITVLSRIQNYLDRKLKTA